MDGNNIARPERLSKQLLYLLDNNLGVVGFAMKLIDLQGKWLIQSLMKSGIQFILSSVFVILLF